MKVVSIIAGILAALLVISACVTGVLFDRGAYTRMLDKTGLPESVGMSEDEVLANYDALIDYNSVFFTGPLEFPTLPMSEAGRIHFEEVKAIFSGFQLLLIVSAILLAICCFLLLRRRQFRFLLLGGILSLLIPAAAAGVMGAVGWDRFFVLFHELAFDNEFWVFDAQTDPIILLLPDAFFLGCLVRIITSIIIVSAILIAVSWVGARRNLRK